VKAKGKITNGEYQNINEISERIASREISELVKANKTIYLYSHISI
jgi:predicted HTH transcriptional regulator